MEYVLIWRSRLKLVNGTVLGCRRRHRHDTQSHPSHDRHTIKQEVVPLRKTDLLVMGMAETPHFHTRDVGPAMCREFRCLGHDTTEDTVHHDWIVCGVECGNEYTRISTL
jgi:hypothetical protein